MILITGANGFIGQFLVPQVVKKFPKQKIVAAIGKVNKIHEKKGVAILSELPVKRVSVNLLNVAKLKKLPSSADIVIHLASAVDTGQSDFRVNDEGTKNLLRVLNKLKKNSHFIYTSTAAVWGGRNKFGLLNELIEPQPNNEYGRTKLVGEQLLIQKSKEIGFGLTILRLNTVYGKDLRKDKLFGMVQNLIQKNSFITRLNWPGKFGVVHVDDVVRTIISCIKKKTGLSGGQIFIVSTENVSLPIISKLIHKTLGKTYKSIELPSLVWQTISFTRFINSLFEKVFPSNFYNLFWRVSLITNDVLRANGRRMQQQLPKWKRKKIKKYIKEVII